MISRNTLRSDALKMFEDEKSTLNKLLEANQGKAAMTTNLWIAN